MSAHYCMVCDDPLARHRAFSRQCPHSAVDFSDMLTAPSKDMVCPPVHKFPAERFQENRSRRNDYSWDSSQDSMLRNSSWRVQGERNGKCYWKPPLDSRPRLHAKQDARGAPISVRQRPIPSPISEAPAWPGQSSYVTSRIARQ